MKQIALYGKGGIGKSTTAANLSAALASQGLNVMQIGCDPKRDSTRMLMQGRLIPTVMDLVRERGDAEISREDIVYNGFMGVRCVEAGDPSRESVALAAASSRRSRSSNASGPSMQMLSFTMSWATWSVAGSRCRCGKGMPKRCTSSRLEN